MAPRYKVLEDSFFEPDLVRAGSIIETDVCPGPHLEPMNEEAVAKMEEWLTWETDEIDPKTKKPTGEKIRPNEKYRRVAYDPAAQHVTTIIAEPTPEAGPTLAELQVKTATNQRPGPKPALTAKPTTSKSTAEVMGESAKAAVISAAPPTTSVKGGPA